MEVNNNHENETQTIKSEFDKLNISDNNCSYCSKPFSEKLWCKDCDPFRIIEGWTSGNPNIDKFIKDTMYDVRYHDFDHDDDNYYKIFLEWVPFDRFTDVKQIGEGGFAKVYIATWMDCPLHKRLTKQNDEGWKKLDPEPMEVALKRLIGSQNMSAE